MSLLSSKILTQLAYPLGMALLFGLAAVVLGLSGRRRTGIGLAVVALAVLWIMSTPGFSYAMRGVLENQWIPVPPAERAKADAVVVLGGGLRSTNHGTRLNLGAAADRVLYAAELYHSGRAPLIIASGGAAKWLGIDRPEAAGTARLLMRLGVPEAAIRTEAESRTTRENALNMAILMDRMDLERILLVTSALHMRRAQAAFRRVGIHVIPAPTDFETLGREASAMDWIPDAAALEGSSRAIKEFFGYAVYEWRGWVE